MPSALEAQCECGCIAAVPVEEDSSARTDPNRATTKPGAMTVSPERTQAGSVRSAAKKTRG